MNTYNIDVYALSKIKERKGEHAKSTAGINILIYKKFESVIQKMEHLNQNAIRVTLEPTPEPTNTGRTYFIGIYASDMSKPNKKSKIFF